MNKRKKKKPDPLAGIFHDVKTAILKQNLMLSVLLYSLLFLYKLVEWPLGFMLKEAFYTHKIDNKELS